MAPQSGRRPIAAGRFYPGESGALRKEIDSWLTREEGPVSPEDHRLWGLMLPHAGYIFCGRVLGATLAGQSLPRRLIILCPNHTGRGETLAVWPDGFWSMPFGPIAVDAELAAALIATDGGFRPDKLGHLGEHSIEVLLPFLQYRVPEDLRITPICVRTQDTAVLARAGQAMASVLGTLKAAGEDVLIIISSDMNHYESEVRTREKDALALSRALACDAEGLLETVRCENISMCGAGPLALALFAAHAMGQPQAVLIAHDTSATAFGDREHTVGYAGLRFYMRQKQ